MVDISVKQIKNFALEAQGVLKVLKGSGIAGGSAALTVATMHLYPAFMPSPEVAAVVTAIYGIVINFLRKFLLKYEIDITRGE